MLLQICSGKFIQLFVIHVTVIQLVSSFQSKVNKDIARLQKRGTQNGKKQTKGKKANESKRGHDGKVEINKKGKARKEGRKEKLTNQLTPRSRVLLEKLIAY